MQSLLRTLNPAVPLSDELLRRLQIVDEHDYGVVRWKTREELIKIGNAPTEEYLDAGLLALKQYYAIALIDGGNMHAVSDAVDPFWHAHILDTEDYTAFCDRIADRYLHHRPLNHMKPVDVQFVAGLYRFTRERYEQCFTFFDERFHPVMLEDERLVCLHGGDEAALRFAAFGVVPEAQPTGTSFAH